MAYYYGRGNYNSIFDNLALNPLPYPVLLILSVMLTFLCSSWYFNYEEIVETAESQMGLLLLATPLVLIVLVRWMSSIENSDITFFGWSPWDTRRRTYYNNGPSEGGSPWGVAALIVLLLVLVQFQSSFLDSWFG